MVNLILGRKTLKNYHRIVEIAVVYFMTGLQKLMKKLKETMDEYFGGIC